MSIELDDYEKEQAELEASGTMTVCIIQCPDDCWYKNRIGEVFKAYKKPTEYFRGLGYKCTDILGGITITDCEVIENA